MKLYRHTIQWDMDPEDLVKLFAVMQFTATIVEDQLKELPVRLRELFTEVSETDQILEAMEMEDGELERVEH